MKPFYISKYIGGNMIVLDAITDAVGVYSHKGDFLNFGTMEDFNEARKITGSSTKSMGENMQTAVINHLVALITVSDGEDY